MLQRILVLIVAEAEKLSRADPGRRLAGTDLATIAPVISGMVRGVMTKLEGCQGNRQYSGSDLGRYRADAGVGS